MALQQAAPTGVRYRLVRCGAPLQALRVPVPQPEGEEVVLRMLAAGVCHTDLHLSDGYFDLGHGRRLDMTQRGIRLPHTPGHENVGEVIALGPHARGVKVGERVLVHPWIGCGQCDACATGDESFCASPCFLGVFREGGFGDHLVVPQAKYLLPIGSLPPERVAPLACSGLTAYSALLKLKDQWRNDRIAIVGAGGLGLMALALLRDLGAKGAVVIEVDASRREAALALGALEALSPEQAEAVAARAPLGGFAAVIDFVGSGASVEMACQILRKGGRLVVVGMYGGSFELPVPTLVLKSLQLQGSYVGTLDELRELLAHVKRHGLAPVPVSTRPMGEVNEALCDLREGRVVGRTVLLAPSTEHGVNVRSLEMPA